MMKQFKLNILSLLLGEIYQNKEMPVVLLTASINFKVGMHADIYVSVSLSLV